MILQYTRENVFNNEIIVINACFVCAYGTYLFSLCYACIYLYFVYFINVR